MIKESIETIVADEHGNERSLRIVKDDDYVEFILNGITIFGMDWSVNLKEVITLMQDKWD